MKKQILEAVNEMDPYGYGKEFKSLAEVKEAYTDREVLDLYLKYEGISGYTDKILGVLETLDSPEVLRTIKNSNGQLYDVIAETKNNYTLLRSSNSKEHIVAYALKEYKDGFVWGHGIYFGTNPEPAIKLFEEKANIIKDITKKGKSR